MLSSLVPSALRRLAPCAALLAATACLFPGRAEAACTPGSPLGSGGWDTGGTPAVATAHILCGRIERESEESTGRVDGFHARPAGKDPKSARATGARSEVSLGVYRHPGVEIYDAQKRRWTSRSLPAGQNGFYFFPDKLTEDQLVAMLRRAYARCTSPVNRGAIRVPKEEQPLSPRLLCVRPNSEVGNQSDLGGYDIAIWLSVQNGAVAIDDAHPVMANTCSGPGARICN